MKLNRRVKDQESGVRSQELGVTCFEPKAIRRILIPFVPFIMYCGGGYYGILGREKINYFLCLQR